MQNTSKSENQPESANVKTAKLHEVKECTLYRGGLVSSDRVVTTNGKKSAEVIVPARVRGRTELVKP